MNKIKKLYRILILVIHVAKAICGSLYGTFYLFIASVFQGNGLAASKVFVHQFLRFSREFYEMYRENYNNLSVVENKKFKELRKLTLGLHETLPTPDLFSFSILMPVYQPQPRFFKIALESALDQTSPHMEILVGFDGPQSPAVLAVLEELRVRRDDGRTKILDFKIDRKDSGGGISNTTNFLAKKAKNKFLLLVDHDDWLRPDLLYRYEQTLRLSVNPAQSVLYCNEFKIDHRDRPIVNSYLSKPNTPVFPYLFINWVCHCLLISKQLWNDVGGLDPKTDGAQDFDLVLKCDLKNANILNVPFFLYAWRVHPQSTSSDINQKSYATQAGILALQKYAASRQLDWKIEPGLTPTSYRAIPKSKAIANVHVIIPFRDQEELTHKCVDSLLLQKNVALFITAVDNGSKNQNIARDLEKKGVEVLKLDIPFNFSRINNFAAKNSKHRGQTTQILFINNDVFLDPGAIEEMTSWLDQPKIGMVGAQLNYPDGRLQHGGIKLDPRASHNVMAWTHIDGGMPRELRGFSNTLNIVDGVTAACAVIKRNIFEAVGGFDEIWYPIAYSDTCLAEKLKARGLYCLYTPFASGIHHESASRKLHNLEDFEASRWLSEKFNTQICKDL